MKLRSWCLACLLAMLMPLAAAQEVRLLSRGQLLFLPVYSHLLYGNLGRSRMPSKVLLSALVSIRNTDPVRPLRLVSARYYETQGRMLRDFLVKPVMIPPLGTHELFVELHDDSGGSGANFLIRWESDSAMNPPLVEAVHANLDSGKAVVFTTQAQPVSE